MALTATTDQSFATDVLTASAPVLVDVWAAWCAPCKAITPMMERLAASYDGRASFVTLDADTNLETVTRYQVRSLPTLLLFDGGVLVERLTGAPAFGTLTAAIDRQLQNRLTGAAPVAAAPVAARPIATGAAVEADALLASPEPMVVFKHSATCGVSLSVKRRYDAFVAAHPDVATRVVIVQTERPLSDALEDATRIQHESPQALVVRNGRVIWHASHGQITADALAGAVQMAIGARGR